MTKKEFLTAPVPSTKLPKGIPYIIGNEAAERFSFYGMKCILVMFMARYLLGRDGRLDVMNPEEAKACYHTFVWAVYFFPIIGALVSDIWLGKYKTIIWLSIVYCLGHLALAIDQTRTGLFIGLTLIVIGSGGIKPCVSANVGDQFGQSNKHLIKDIFGWFYFSINFGCFFSMLLTPIFLDYYGPHVAFGVPGILMGIATLVFWMGRHKFVHVPPRGLNYIKECFQGEGLQAIKKLSLIFVFVIFFFSLFEQSGSAWVLQTEKMNRTWLGHEWLPSQIQMAGPFLVMVIVPFFSFIAYPFMGKFMKVTPLRKIGIGLFVASATFILSAYIESKIDGGDIAKHTSRAAVQGVEATKVLDGKSDKTGWSSADPPSIQAPQELVIRLRQRQAWDISCIQIDPATALSKREYIAILDDLIFKEKTGIPDDQATQANINILNGALKQIKKVKNDMATIRNIAAEAITQAGQSPDLIDNHKFSPKDISFYAADFTGKMLPELNQLDSHTTRDELINHTTDKGWRHLGHLSLNEKPETGELLFDTIKATHVLVQINSNYGANRVKIAEIQVNAAGKMTEIASETAGVAWPNVAAIGYKPSILWQFLAYFLITAAEVLVSVTCLEFAYTQSPNKMKSFIMALFLMSISLGNAVTAGVNHFIQNPDGSVKLAGADYYYFFAIMMLVTALIFIFIARGYKEQSYIQHESA